MDVLVTPHGGSEHSLLATLTVHEPLPSVAMTRRTRSCTESVPHDLAHVDHDDHGLCLHRDDGDVSLPPHDGSRQPCNSSSRRGQLRPPLRGAVSITRRRSRCAPSPHDAEHLLHDDHEETTQLILTTGNDVVSPTARLAAYVLVDAGNGPAAVVINWLVICCSAISVGDRRSSAATAVDEPISSFPSSISVVTPVGAASPGPSRTHSRMHSNSLSNLFPFPPQPVYLKVRQRCETPS